MKYTFDILGISPVLDFFTYQQTLQQNLISAGVEYLGTYQCTLDCFLASVENIRPKQGWDMDRVVDTVIQFWLNHADRTRYWKERLNDAGQENLLVLRLADLPSLKVQFESLLGESF